MADNGCGIAPELQDTVYDRILHTERMDPLPHGLGLGLPLSRCFARRQGGNLLLHSEAGKGTAAHRPCRTFRSSTPAASSR